MLTCITRNNAVKQRIYLHERTSDEDALFKAFYPEQMIFQVVPVNTVSGDQRAYGRYHRYQKENDCYLIFPVFQ